MVHGFISKIVVFFPTGFYFISPYSEDVAAVSSELCQIIGHLSSADYSQRSTADESVNGFSAKSACYLTSLCTVIKSKLADLCYTCAGADEVDSCCSISNLTFIASTRSLLKGMVKRNTIQACSSQKNMHVFDSVLKYFFFEPFTL